MGAAFLITLREGLEIAIVLAILISYLVKTDRAGEVAAVWRGAAYAAGICVVAGIVIHVAVGGLHGSVEKGVEAVIALAAASVLTWMIFWMREHSRTMGAELRRQVDLTALDVHTFDPGALVMRRGRSYVVGDPFRSPSTLLPTVRAPIGSPLDKIGRAHV